MFFSIANVSEFFTHERMVGLALAQGCFSGNELEHGLPSTKTNLYVIDLPSYNVVTTFLQPPTISSDSAIEPKKIKWY